MIKTDKRLALIATCLMATFAVSESHGQFDDKNLVANPSFEELEPGLRRNEQFDLTVGWSNPTATVSDIFSANAKSKTVALPNNMYGVQDPFDGSNFAGIVVYSPRGKISRTYISVPLTKKLTARGLYCIRYKASLAECSRFASNNLGVLLSKSEIKEKTLTSLSKPEAIYTDLNEVATDRDGWMEFCQMYAANGTETYLTIGNFHSDDRTQSEAMEVAAEFETLGGIQAAYYYIDMVQVEPISIGESCNCAGSRIPESKIIFSGSVELTDEMTPGQKLEAIDAYFYQYKPELVSAAQRSVDKVVDLLVANPTLKCVITGHSDNEEVALAEKESAVKNLAEKRAKATKDYMEAQGIDSSRLSVEWSDNKKPVSTSTTPLSLAKNRRVEFAIKP